MRAKYCLCDPPRYDGQSLEAVLETVSRFHPMTIVKGKEALHQVVTSDDVALYMPSLPQRIWQTARYVFISYPIGVTNGSPVFDGCLIRAGLPVVEALVGQGPVSTKCDLDHFFQQECELDQMGFLNRDDLARLLAIAKKCKCTLMSASRLCMMAGLAQSLWTLPPDELRFFQEEVERLRKHLSEEYQ